MPWKNNLITDSHDEDYNLVVRPSAVLRYMQTAANTQLHELGPTTAELLAAGKAFILSSIDVSIHRAMHAYESICCHTWPCVPHGFSMPRCYQLFDEAGQETARGIALFALIDIESRKIVRPSDVSLPFNTSAHTEPLLDTKAVRFTVPHVSDMKCAGTYTVTYSQTDLNHHLNNTYYPDMFASFVCMDGRRVSHFGIRFLSEAPLGETLTVYTEESGDSCRFISLRSNGEINAEAEMNFASI